MAGCTSPRAEFDRARSTDTVSSYQRFLTQYPKSEFASEAQARVSELQEIEFQKKFEAAKRSDTLPGWDKFLKDNRGNAKDEAQIREATDRRDSLLIEQCDSEKSRSKLWEFLKSHSHSRFAAQARSRLEACQTNAVPDSGEILWTSTNTLDKANAQYVLDVRCSWKQAAAQRKESGPSNDASINKLIGANDSWGVLFAGDTSAIPNQSADFPIAYPLRFSETTDRVMIWKSPIFGEKLVVLEGSAEIHEKVQQNTSASMTLFLSVQITKEPSTLYVSGGQFVSTVGQQANVLSFRSSSQGVAAGTALVEGKIALPTNDWVLVKRGIEARGGELLFQSNKIVLSPGTMVVRYPEMLMK
jgi:hypothetical protein